MMSTGDAPNDEAEEAFAPPRLRRSTYTPPPQYRDVVALPDADQLADLTATDAAQPAVPRPASAAPDGSDDAVTPVRHELDLPALRWDRSDEPAALPPEHAAPYRPWVPDPPAAELPVADPATLAPPAGQPWIPRRRSLPDDELLSVLGETGRQPGGTLSAIDTLENEMRLREEEVQEYREWEQSMLAVGTPEALAAVAQVRPVFSEITIPEELTTSQIPVQWAPDFPASSTPAPPAMLSISAPPALVEPSAAPPPSAPRAISVDTGGIASIVLTAPAAAPVAPGPATAAPSTAPAAAPTVASLPPAAGSTPTLAEHDGPPTEFGRERAPVFSLELSGLRPTPVDYRVGRASRLFWLWFAANSSLVSVAFGAVVLSLGMSLRQAIVATLAGVALSFIPLGLGTLAGKRSGQPTVVVSRAAFGIAGNIVPAVLALVTRVFWGAVLLWLFAASIAGVLGGGGPTSGLVIVFIVVGVMLAVVVAFLGYALLARFQLAASVLSALLIVGFVAITAGRVDVAAALTRPDGSWVLVTTGAILVFSFVGLVWANSSSDLARYQRPESSSGGNMLWATFGTAVPTFLLIAYGALLAASDPALASGLATRPIETLQSIVPGWYAVPLIATIGVSLLSAVVVTVYSGAFALQGVGVRLERQWATLVVGVLLAILAGLFSVLSDDLTAVFRDLATTLAVPVAAWVGIFAADAMIRNRPLHGASLLGPGGVYPSVNWVNLPALVGITVVGWGLTSASSGGLAWQGYLFAVGGVPLDSELAASDLGVIVALVLGLLTPIIAGVPTVRRQETAAALL
ncbi:MAG: hypothetical protein JWM50_2525 [Microbacteriaceae bacterium]|jgi:purine-cytosine permease-like protein|nr:hypothetical protein [Microbacteriaceae bacterium]